jgi:hypothetical protein
MTILLMTFELKKAVVAVNAQLKRSLAHVSAKFGASLLYWLTQIAGRKLT